MADAENIQDEYTTLPPSTEAVHRAHVVQTEEKVEVEAVKRAAETMTQKMTHQDALLVLTAIEGLKTLLVMVLLALFAFGAGGIVLFKFVDDVGDRVDGSRSIGCQLADAVRLQIPGDCAEVPGFTETPGPRFEPRIPPETTTTVP